jgi:hypothetical protein
MRWCTVNKNFVIHLFEVHAKQYFCHVSAHGQVIFQSTYPCKSQIQLSLKQIYPQLEIFIHFKYKLVYSILKFGDFLLYLIK